MWRIAALAGVLVLALVAGACTTKAYVVAAAKKTSTNTTTTTTLPPTTTTIATVPAVAPAPIIPTTTIPPCTGDVVTVLPGESNTVLFDNIPEPGVAYTVVVTSVLYKERSDPLNNIHVTFSYVTADGGTGTGTGATLTSPYNSVLPGGSTAWTTDVPTTSPMTSVTITGISYNDLAAGPGCNA